MGVPCQAGPVKLFCGLIYRDEEDFRAARAMLEGEFGRVELEAGPMPFNFTTYYEKEMGSNLLRRFLGFERLVDPGTLSSVKLRTNEMERLLAGRRRESAGRVVNIDPGYLDGARVVLATTKDRAHRIYAGLGIYAEVTLLYRDGAWRPLEWTYPDYRTAEYLGFFASLRAAFLSRA